MPEVVKQLAENGSDVMPTDEAHVDPAEALFTTDIWNFPFWLASPVTRI
jgi:hypothetical protein